MAERTTEDMNGATISPGVDVAKIDCVSSCFKRDDCWGRVMNSICLERTVTHFNKDAFARESRKEVGVVESEVSSNAKRC